MPHNRQFKSFLRLRLRHSDPPKRPAFAIGFANLSQTPATPVRRLTGCYMARYTYVVCAVLLCATLLSDASAEELQSGYSTVPLRDPIYDEAELAVEVVGINNWLAENLERLPPQAMKGPREHLYYLIDSRVKQIFSQSGKVMPQEHDLYLDILFSWSERLGVFGGALVHNSLRGPNTAASHNVMTVPGQFELNLVVDSFHLSSREFKWSARFPYYFMIGHLQEFEATNGLRTQIAMVSTGAARDTTPAQKSQGTILLMFSPTEDHSLFSKYWIGNTLMSDSYETRKIEGLDRTSFYTFEQANKLHKEITTWKTGSGSFGIAFVGMDGTFQWNRIHYLDFLRTFSTE